jgi:hypothetical protein
MISATFDARGLEADFERLYSKVTVGAVGDSLVEAVKPFRDDCQTALEAAAQGPYSTGRTAAQGVRVDLAYSSDEGPVVVVGVKARGKKARAHVARWLALGIPSRGIPAKPWFRPSLDAHLPQFLPRFVAALKKRVSFS